MKKIRIELLPHIPVAMITLYTASDDFVNTIISDYERGTTSFEITQDSYVEAELCGFEYFDAKFEVGDNLEHSLSRVNYVNLALCSNKEKSPKRPVLYTFYHGWIPQDAFEFKTYKSDFFVIKVIDEGEQTIELNAAKSEVENILYECEELEHQLQN